MYESFKNKKKSAIRSAFDSLAITFGRHARQGHITSVIVLSAATTVMGIATYNTVMSGKEKSAEISIDSNKQSPAITECPPASPN